MVQLQDRITNQASLNIVLQDLVEGTKKECREVEFHIKCIPEPLEPLMEASGVKGIRTDYLAQGLEDPDLAASVKKVKSNNVAPSSIKSEA